MEEIWKPIPSLSGYEASSEGNIRSIDRVFIYKHRWGGESARHYKGKILKKQLRNRDGYNVVGIRKDGKVYPYKVSRLVAEAFLGTSKLEVDHINRNRADDRVCNLRYLSRQSNLKNKSNQDKEWDPTFEIYI